MPAGVIVTGNFSKDLLPNISKWFGDAYKDHDTQYDKIFTVSSSDRAFEEDVIVGGLGLASVVGQGESVVYDTMGQGFTKRYEHIKYANGFIITREMLEDGQSDVVSRQRSMSLKKSMMDTREIVAMNVLNRAFTSTYAGGDGKELCATDHPTQSEDLRNKLTTAADLSESSLEQAIIDLGDFRNYRGLKIRANARKLVIPVSLQFEAERILHSNLRVNSANNDPNAMKNLGMLQEMPIVSTYLTDTDAWFILTDVPDSLRFLNRRDMAVTTDNDFDTENAKFKAVMRFAVGWSDPRGIFGSPGA